MTNAEELIAKLINEKKITGEEAVILLSEMRNYPYVNTWVYPYQQWPQITWSTTSLQTYNNENKNL